MSDSILMHPPARSSRVPAAPPRPERASLPLTVDGRSVHVPEGSTVLDACHAVGVEIPTLCFLKTLTPVNACRICVVEVEGSRVLVPACSRKAEAGMKILTESERVRLSRRLVLELLGSAVDLSTSPGLPELMERYDARPERFGAGAARATVEQPVKEDNELYVRDYAKCVLCYKCVEACGVDAQNTFAIAVAGRGFDAHISTEWDVPLPTSACVYCGNCIAVCPTGALMPTSEFELRRAGDWNEERQTQTDTICGYCGVGCTLTVHVQDERIVKIGSPFESQVTHGNLCVKGRFGYEIVQGAAPRRDDRD